MANESGECEPKLFEVSLETFFGDWTHYDSTNVLGCQHQFVASSRKDGLNDGHVRIQRLGVDYSVKGAVENHRSILD